MAQQQKQSGNEGGDGPGTPTAVPQAARSIDSSVRALRDIFSEGARLRLVAIEGALARLWADASDRAALKEVRTHLHCLAGSAGSYGFPRVSELARAGELSCDQWVAKEEPIARDDLQAWADLAATLGQTLVVSRTGQHPVQGPAPVQAPRLLVFGPTDDLYLPAPGESFTGCVVDRVESIDGLSHALAHDSPLGVVLVADDDPRSMSVAIRAVRAHSGVGSTPVLVLCDRLSLLERIELMQQGATRVLPRDTPWDVIVTLSALAQPAADVRQGLVFALISDPQLGGVLQRDLAGPLTEVRLFVDLARMFEAWQVRAPDVVLLPLHADTKAAWDAMAQLRARMSLRKLPVVALIRDDDDRARRAAFELGAEDYVALPYVPGELAARVELRLELARLKWRQRRAAPLAALHSAASSLPLVPPPASGSAIPVVTDDAPTSPVAAKRTVRVLVADDDSLVTQLLETRFRSEGWDCTVANNGEEAERLLEANAYQLVLLDLNMPFRSGFDILRWLSQRGLKRAAKVAVLTAVNRDETALRAFSLEADDFIPKPFNPDVVVGRLKRLLVR